MGGACQSEKQDGRAVLALLKWVRVCVCECMCKKVCVCVCAGRGGKGRSVV